MPTPSTRQSQMPVFMGKAAGVDSDHQIDDIAFKLNIVAKTSDYSVLAKDSGTLFTTEGATAAVDFTLPATADGLVYWFFVAEDYELKVTADTADTLIAFNDVAADSVAFTTANEQVGGAFMVFSDGSKWMATGLLGGDAQTITVAT